MLQVNKKTFIWILSNKALFCFGGFLYWGCTKSRKGRSSYTVFSPFSLSFFNFLLKVWCLCGTTQQMNILSAEVGSLEAVNLNSRNVQTQFITCSPELTFSYFIWFHSGVFVGSTLQSLAIGLKQPWKKRGKEQPLHSPVFAIHTELLFRLVLVDEGFINILLTCLIYSFSLL